MDIALATEPCGASQLDEAREAATQALASLRVLAHGVFPPALITSGLPAALDQFLDETGLPVTVRSGAFGTATPAEVALFFGLAALLPPMAAASEVSVTLTTTGGGAEPAEVVAVVRGADQPPATTELYVRDRLEARDGYLRVQLDAAGQAEVTLAVPQADAA